MRIIDGGECWTWAKPEDVQPLSPTWKKVIGTLTFSALIVVLVGLWGWVMALVAAFAIHEMLED